MRVKLFISLFAIGLLAFNFSQKESGEGEKGMALQNVAVMQANAGEWGCNPSTDNPCTIQTDNVTGRGRGVLTYND
jgi:hypothetical protein